MKRTGKIFRSQDGMILVTGNLGYVGSVLGGVLNSKGYKVVGLDTGYYQNRVFSGQSKIFRQIRKDIREVVAEDLKGIKAVVHLAALSNDPLGELDKKLTEEINFKATVRLAKLAKAAGVERFVYSSSQSMYGVADTSRELGEEAEKNPVTVYAKTKWQAEQALKKLDSPEFTVVCLRPSTVFGASPSFRSDIVFNNLVACAFTTGRIEIKSDGRPWRPVIHVRDLSNAFLAALAAPRNLVAGESFNVGLRNFTVRELAEAAQRVVPKSALIFTGEHGADSRTYRISFKKIEKVLGKYYKPKWDLNRGGKDLVAFFKKAKFKESDFRGSRTNRLSRVKELLEEKRIDRRLFWR